MKTSRASVTVSMMSLLLLQSAHAQILPELQSGTPVRLTVLPVSPAESDEPLRLEGDLLQLGSESMVIATSSGEQEVALENLLSLEAKVPRSHGRGALRGLGWGALVGAGAGTVTGLLVSINDEEYRWLNVSFGAIVFGAIGGGAGAAIGAAYPGERWAEVRRRQRHKPAAIPENRQQ